MESEKRGVCASLAAGAVYVIGEQKIVNTCKVLTESGCINDGVDGADS